GGRILVVGRDQSRALDLAQGKEDWRCDTGTPSGQGMFVGDLYFLPLKAAGPAGQAELCVLDVVKGRVVQHGPMKNAPGNLLFHDGCAFTQGATSLSACGED